MNIISRPGRDRAVRRRALALAALLGVVLLVSGCTAAAEEEPQDDRLSVVASTNVYGSVAAALGGETVQVTSVIDDPSQDPHDFEADARVQLALSKADIVIQNGGGYDFFMQTLLSGAGNADAVVLNASQLSGLEQESVEFNEHVWFNLTTMKIVADRLLDAYTELDAANAAAYEERAASFSARLDEVFVQAATARDQLEGMSVAVTEPLPAYLLESLGMVDVTPADFSEAIEEGSGVPPVVLAEALGLVEDGTARLLIHNDQTITPETDRIRAAADAAGIPVIGVTEILPDDMDYLDWVSELIETIRAAATAPGS